MIFNSKKNAPLLPFDIRRFRRGIFVSISVLTIVAAFFVSKLRFSFDFEQFFPQGDDDLIFFQNFTKSFETDDNFLLIAIPNHSPSKTLVTEGGETLLLGGVFDTLFLQKFSDFSDKSLKLPFVTQAQSLTTLRLPIKTPFGITAIPALHLDDLEALAYDRKKILRDERFVRNLISEDGNYILLFLKTKDRITLEESEILMQQLNDLIKTYSFENFHFLGRANFQKELVYMEKREVAVSSLVAAILVAIVMGLLFRRWRTVVIALASIGLAMLFFLGILGAWGRELSAMAALYPVLMVIVGTADVIHILSKYIDELRRGHSKELAIWLTIKEIGLATFMTAITTATGFATLVTSRIIPIQEFGINAAVGVMVAYTTVLVFTTALLSYFSAEELTQIRAEGTIWDKLMLWTYRVTKFRARLIAMFAFALLGVCIFGATKIKTNYSINDNMPLHSKVTEDFHVFEQVFAGFRPLEYAVFAQNGHKANDFEVLHLMDKLEKYLKDSVPSIRSVNSVTMLYKSLNLLFDGSYLMPSEKSKFNDYQLFIKDFPLGSSAILLSKDETKARIATRILDLGADSVMAVGDKIDAWISRNTDPSVATFKRTGTGFIIDKNAMYVRDDLLEGLLWEVSLIAILMGLMLRNVRMIIIFLIPNLFPLVFAAALLGFLGVDLDAGISMIFTVVFGIAIDDTIHFLSSFRINKDKGLTVDEALRTTLLETGKPVVLTTIILFFGFMVMIFSIHPPSVVVGKLIAVTLVTALMSDLFINPLLIRWLIKD